MFVSMNWIKDFVNLDGWDLEPADSQIYTFYSRSRRN